jgi:4-amino-4-deoxy-L-arabinose transferase-like glycosyltransferase
MHDEVDNVEPFWAELREVLATLDEPAEVVFVDDASTDGTGNAIRAVAATDARVRCVPLATRHGLTGAFRAGYAAATGDVIVTLDGDLQSDPRDIPKLLAALDHADAAVGWRGVRHDTVTKRVSSRLANAVRRRVLGDRFQDSACSLRALPRRCLSVLPPYDGMHRFLPVLLSMHGYVVTEVPVVHRPRQHGRSKFGIRNRAWRSLVDCLAVRWMRTRMIPPAGDDASATPVAEPARIGWIAVAAALALALVDIGARTLATNDEARFPVLAQSILAGGDWLVPWLNGTPYVNKPPLLALAIAAAAWPMGSVTQLAAALPSVLAGLLTVYAVYRLGREMWNPAAGRYAAAVAATTHGLFEYARIPMPDMLLTAFTGLSLWALQRMRRPEPRLAWLAFYGAVAAAFWTKGPAGLMPLGVALAYALLRRRAEPIGWLRLVPGLLVLGALVAPWSIAAALRAAGAVQHAVVDKYVLWYLPQQPSFVTLLTSVGNALSMVIPWAWLVPFALHDAWRCRRGRGAERDGLELVLVWIVGVFAMVSLSGQQRIRYYLPLVPPLALVLGWWIAAAAVERRVVSLWRFRWTALLLGTGAAVAVAAPLTQGRASHGLPMSAGPLALMAIAGATLIVVMERGLRARHARHFGVAVLAAAVFVAVLYHAEQTQRNAAEDYRAVARLADQARAANQPVATLGIPVLPVAFYLGERVVELVPDLPGAPPVTPATMVIVANAAALRAHDVPLEATGRARLGKHDVVIGRSTEPLARLPAAGALTVRRTARPAEDVWLMAFEMLCLAVALAAALVRTSALRHGTDRTVVHVAEATIVLALASFPRHAAVFVGGVVAAGAWAYLRGRRLPLPERPEVSVAGLLMLALPLDLLEDVVQGHAIRLDPLWVASAALGVALLLWMRWRRGLHVAAP